MGQRGRLHLCHRGKPYLEVRSAGGDFIVRSSWSGEILSVWRSTGGDFLKKEVLFAETGSSAEEFRRELRAVLADIEPWRRRRRQGGRRKALALASPVVPAAGRVAFDGSI